MPTDRTPATAAGLRYCGFPSSVSDKVCILPPGHPGDTALRFHRFQQSGLRGLRDELRVLPMLDSRREALFFLLEVALNEAAAAARSEGAEARETVYALREATASRDAEVRALREALQGIAALHRPDPAWPQDTACQTCGAPDEYPVESPCPTQQIVDAALAAGPAPVPAAGLDVEP